MAENKKLSTAKEALLAELFGDIGEAITKLDEVLEKSALVERELSVSTKALILASQKYKDAINGFTDEAKKDISSHIERETAQHTAPVLKRLTEQNNKELSDRVNNLKWISLFNTGLIVIGFALAVYFGLS